MVTPAYWRQSAAAMRNLRSLVFAALMIAAYVALSAAFVPVGGAGGPRIMIRFLPQVLIGAVCGPVVGFVAGIAGDLVGHFSIPTGEFFFGYTVTAAVRGLLYGLFLYRKPIAVSLGTSADQVILRFAFCQFAVNALCHVGLNVLWRTMLWAPSFDSPQYFIFLGQSATTNLIQWPFQVILMIALCKVLGPVLKRMDWMTARNT
jgi:ECF transporter S component (folate family)